MSKLFARAMHDLQREQSPVFDAGRELRIARRMLRLMQDNHARLRARRLERRAA